MSEMVTVREMAKRLDVGADTVRRGILDGSLPGTAVHGAADRMKFIIPRPAFDLYVQTGITPMMLAQSVCGAETIQQGIAIIRAVFDFEVMA